MPVVASKSGNISVSKMESIANEAGTGAGLLNLVSPRVSSQTFSMQSSTYS